MKVAKWIFLGLGAVFLLLALAAFLPSNPFFSFAGFAGHEAAAVGVIGGADGPTAIFVSSFVSPGLLLGGAAVLCGIVGLVIALIAKNR